MYTRKSDAVEMMYKQDLPIVPALKYTVTILNKAIKSINRIF